MVSAMLKRRCARTDGHHQLHDGLRYHRHRARHRVGQVQATGRRRDAEDRQPNGAASAWRRSVTISLRSSRSWLTLIAKIRSKEPRTSSQSTWASSIVRLRQPVVRGALLGSSHVTMMAAAQPFLSGAISKTVNMPRETTPEEIALAYYDGWKLGLKALAIYRDGSKDSQPLNTKLDSDKTERGRSGSEQATP